MSDIEPILGKLAQVSDLATAGYALAFHIRFTSPTFLLQAYPKAWTTYYSIHALVMADPTVAWGFANDGSCRWSMLTDDPAGVMQRAADHGLQYGVVCAVDSQDSRSFGSFARSDREFTDQEIDTLHAGLLDVHDATATMDDLPTDYVSHLRDMSIQYAKG